MFVVGVLLLSGAFPAAGPPGENDGPTALASAAGQVPGPAEPTRADLGLDGTQARTGEGSVDLPDVHWPGLHLVIGDDGHRMAGHRPQVFKPPRLAV